MRRALKRARRRLVYLALRGAFALLGRLSPRASRVAGQLIGAIAHALARRERAIAREQLAWALERSPEEAARIARAMFDHFGLVVVELARFARDPSAIEREVDLPEESRRALEGALAEGKGAVAVSAHLGNWELLPRRVARLGISVAAAARKNANAGIDAWIVAERAKNGVSTIHRRGGARELLRALRGGGVFALLIDQSTKVPSVSVPFFGRPAPTPRAAAELALRGRPLVAGFVIRAGERHRIGIERVPVEPGDDVERLSARLSALIERRVREAPEQWVWFHERWRPR